MQSNEPMPSDADFPPIHERNRVNTLHAQDLLDTPSEVAFDRLARIAACTLEAPLAVVALVDAERQWNKATYGTTIREVDRSVSLASAALERDGITMLHDLQADDRFDDNPFVHEEQVDFYAAATLETTDGHRLGVLAVMDTMSRPLSNEQKKTLSDLAQTTAHEIERRRKQQQDEGCLRGTEHFFARCPDPLCMVSVEGELLRVNPAFARVTGYSIEELTGQSYLDMVHPDDYEDTVQVVERLARGEEIDLFTNRFECKNGSYRWFEWNSLICERGIIYAAARDVTDLKRTEQKLTQIQKAVESASDAIAIIDLEGYFLYVNPAFEKLFGVDQTELNTAGHAGSRLFVNEQRGRHIIENVRGGTSWQGEVKMKTAEGDVLDITLRGSPIVDNEGNVAAVVGIHTDITQYKQAEEALRESEKLAATGRMAAGIAHEINNPLAGIKNAFELVKSAVPEDHEYHPFVKRINAEIERIRRIVHQMYTLYRPDQEEPSYVDFSQLFSDANLVLEPTAREQRVELTFEDRTDETSIRLVEGYTRQILYNLVRNAIQAAPPESTVRVAAECGEEDVIIEVADQGQGIAPAIRDRIFEPFFSRSSSDESEAMGLGLSVSRALVESMGGAIQFDTEVGEGTTFTCTFPKKHPISP